MWWKVGGALGLLWLLSRQASAAAAKSPDVGGTISVTATDGSFAGQTATGDIDPHTPAITVAERAARVLRNQTRDAEWIEFSSKAMIPMYGGR